MLLTVKDLAAELQIKPATLYAWAAQEKIPCLKIHGVIRFEPQKIDQWLKTFGVARVGGKLRPSPNRAGEPVEALIARAKASVYSAPRGNQTNSEPNRKEERWGS